jgi:enoyl-CoA hydratase
MQAFETLLLERSGNVVILTVNRPDKRNALNATVRREIVDALDALRGDDACRVLVLTGAGDKAFVAGADINEFAQRTPLEQRATMNGRLVFEELADFPKPTIALINGFALGGGCELALACDIVLQPDLRGLVSRRSSSASFLAAAAATLPRVVGPGQALRLIYSGEVISAEEASRIGLVDLLFDDAEARTKTLELATTIAAHSPVALQLAKNAVRAALEAPLSAGLRYERELFITAFASEDKREGVAAFLEKRTAEFRGR